MQVYLFPESVRIQVDSVYPLAPVQDQYFVRKASFLKLYYYVQEIGLIPTLIKVISRWKERARNRKFMLVGQGRVLETSGGSFKSGDSVVFIAPNHAEYEAEVVVHESCVCLKAPQPSCAEEPSAWYTPLMGWSPYSGSPCPALEILHLKNRLLALWAQVQGKSNVVAPKAVEPFQKPSSLLDASSNLSAVLFGLGNYAKTCILPNLHRQIELVKIHEIDPAQFAFEKRGVMYDTSPWPRADERFDVVIVA
ncbi:MAG: hypothetical protein EBX40_08205, partial [Gammaproteobacteria bacterium]|nr:hypothetical protein [Gammaproteobacteria bacterium]